MTYSLVTNLMMSVAAIGVLVTGRSWATLAMAVGRTEHIAPAAQDADFYRQVIVERRLAHGVA